MKRENYTLFTETDPNAHLTVKPYAVTGRSYDAGEQAWLVDQRHPLFFVPHFIQEVEVEITGISGTAAGVIPWALQTDDAWPLGSADSLIACLQRSPTVAEMLFSLARTQSGVPVNLETTGSGQGWPVLQRYYLRMCKQSFQVWLEVYDDANRSNLLGATTPFGDPVITRDWLVGAANFGFVVLGHYLEAEVANLDLKRIEPLDFAGQSVGGRLDAAGIRGLG